MSSWNIKMSLEQINCPFAARVRGALCDKQSVKASVPKFWSWFWGFWSRLVSAFTANHKLHYGATQTARINRVVSQYGCLLPSFRWNSDTRGIAVSNQTGWMVYPPADSHPHRY